MSIEPTSTEQSHSEDRDAYMQAMREGLRVSVGQLVPIVILAALIVGFWVVRWERAIVAAQELLTKDGADWQAACMPMLLFMIYGLVLGTLCSWRMNSGAGLVGRPAMLVGLVIMMLVAVVGLVTATVTFEDGVPLILWLDMAAMVAGGLPGVLYFSYWAL